MTGISPSISAMACWCTLAIRRRMKTMRSGPCAPGWAWWRPWRTLNRRLGQEQGRPPGGPGGHPHRAGGGGRDGRRRAAGTAWPWGTRRTWRPASRAGSAGHGGDQRGDATGWSQGYFTCHDLGAQPLKGMETPVQVYQVVRASAAQSRLDVAAARGLTPLVGREHEVGCCGSAGRRSRTAWARWCCSAARRALANRAWSRC